jgi:hypothetical protein
VRLVKSEKRHTCVSVVVELYAIIIMLMNSGFVLIAQINPGREISVGANQVTLKKIKMTSHSSDK